MDIGVIGYWFATNYGGVSSYYSLYSALEKMGHTPFLVETPYLAVDKEGVDVFSRNFFKSINARITKSYTNDRLGELNDLADTFVLGSDQVVTISSIRAFGKLFLMEFLSNNKKRIAVSASCGGDNLSNPETLSYAGPLLKKFTAFSVREKSAQSILKEKLSVDSDLVIDPIFLTSSEQFKKLSEMAKLDSPEQPYMAAYVLDPTDDKKTCINDLSAKLGLAAKVILDGRKFTHEKNAEKMGMPECTLPELDLPQWLHYLSNASFIFTDSFHGAAMAIILNKPFVMYANYLRGYPRFVTLAETFNVKERLIDKSSQLTDEILNKKIDFDAINKTIEAERSRLIKWLEHALEMPVKKIEKSPMELQIEKETELLYNNPDFIKIRLIATLLRDYGVKHIVLSPGGRDVPLVRMFEYNSDSFILHKVTDERSAAYFGLGIAAQLRKPVVCVCTSGTAASNYLPAVTEAYYTGVPLIVITADRREIFLNHGEDQTIPQKHIYNGVVKKEITVPEGSGYYAEYQTKRDVSDCILEATHNGSGPVHINISIENISIGSKLPKEKWKILPPINPRIIRVKSDEEEKQIMKWVDCLKNSPRILVVYGQNPPPTKEQKEYIEAFASKFNCVIVTDHISNLDCAYSLMPYNMLCAISQQEFNEHLSPDILISVGGKRLMNDPLTYKVRGGPKNIRHWSVTPDGKVKDFYFRLTSVIECSQDFFFKWFSNHAGNIANNGVYYGKWKELTEKYNAPRIDKFNAQYVQSKFIPSIPANSILHLGVGQSFFDCRRFKMNPQVDVFCNMGTNGIDGCTSTFMGQCSVVKDKLCFLLVGDLSFFYDMNSIWNKNPGKNVRILMVNNNGTGLLRGHGLWAISSVHNTKAKGWVESTGFEYISAKTAEEYEEKLKYFVSNESENPLFFEVFCD
ncbi:MAG: 2-succinyl-5-enolpyruvyl-6-hydroxy-3-cyclohexene-1-carboxylic-acid synthase [Ruminiclostridium sp.]